MRKLKNVSSHDDSDTIQMIKQIRSDLTTHGEELSAAIAKLQKAVSGVENTQKVDGR